MSISKKYKAIIQISFKEPLSIITPNLIAQSICSALMVDIKSSPSDPTVITKISFNDNQYDENNNISSLFIDIEANNIPILRANINSYLRLADASNRCMLD